MSAPDPGTANTQSEDALVHLVERVQQGDLDAYARIFDLYQKRVYNLIYYMVRNPDDAAELTQETFVKAYQSIHRLEYAAAFNTWIFTIASNLARDALRRRTHVRMESLDTPVTTDDDSQMEREFPDEQPSADERLESTELSEVLRAAIETLSPNHRAVITMHHLQGMDVVSIAEVMGCRVGTVKSRLARARNELYHKLRGYVEET